MTMTMTMKRTPAAARALQLVILPLLLLAHLQQPAAARATTLPRTLRPRTDDKLLTARMGEGILGQQQQEENEVKHITIAFAEPLQQDGTPIFWEKPAKVKNKDNEGKPAVLRDCVPMQSWVVFTHVEEDAEEIIKERRALRKRSLRKGGLSSADIAKFVDKVNKLKTGGSSVVPGSACELHMTWGDEYDYAVDIDDPWMELRHNDDDAAAAFGQPSAPFK